MWNILNIWEDLDYGIHKGDYKRVEIVCYFIDQSDINYTFYYTPFIHKKCNVNI